MARTEDRYTLALAPLAWALGTDRADLARHLRGAWVAQPDGTSAHYTARPCPGRPDFMEMVRDGDQGAAQGPVAS